MIFGGASYGGKCLNGRVLLSVVEQFIIHNFGGATYGVKCVNGRFA